MFGHAGATSLRAPLLAFLAVVFVVFVVSLVASRRGRGGEWPETIRISTATKGGTYEVIGRGLAQLLRYDRDRRVAEIEAVDTAGSRVNIERLVRGDTELALVSLPTLRLASDEERASIRTLARLYDGRMQVVVRKDANLESLADLTDQGVYIGTKGGGTEPIARILLEVASVRPDYRRLCETCSFSDAALNLVAEDSHLGVAVFGGGLPTKAVRHALADGKCELLDLGEELAVAVSARVKGSHVTEIPSDFYRHQPDAVHTIATPALLVCRKDLDSDLAEWVLRVLFGNIHRLLDHAVRQENASGGVAIESIRFEDGFPPAYGPYHPGALRYQEEERKKLVIATGSPMGRYYEIGTRIRMLLEQAGLPARVAHTDGSIANARLLAERPILAIMQYDVALATTWGKPEAVYEVMEPLVEYRYTPDGASPPHVPGLRSVARLHEERMYVLARTDRIPPGFENANTVARLEGLRVCVGPDNSGTQVLARAVMHHHEVSPAPTTWLPVRDMTERLREGQIDAGFFVTAHPSTALDELLGGDCGLTLLGVDSTKTAPLTMATSALREETFRSGVPEAYECLEEDVQTLATDAILVTREDMRKVGLITRAVFQGAGLLGIEGDGDLGGGGVERLMAAPLAALEPHPDAVRVYQERGLVAAPDRRLFETIAAIVTSLAVIVGAYRGLQLLREEHLAETIRGDVLRVSLAATSEDAVRHLKAHQWDVRKRAQRRWWQRGGLSNARCNRLEDMIEKRVEKAREELSQALIREARELRHSDDDEARAKRSALRQRLWDHAADGELSELQVLIVLRATGEGAG